MPPWLLLKRPTTLRFSGGAQRERGSCAGAERLDGIGVKGGRFREHRHLERRTRTRISGPKSIPSGLEDEVDVTWRPLGM